MQQITADTIFLPALGILAIIIFLANVLKPFSNNKSKKKKAKPKSKSDFAKQQDTVNLAVKNLKAELTKLKKLAKTAVEKKKVQVTEDRVLNII